MGRLIVLALILAVPIIIWVIKVAIGTATGSETADQPRDVSQTLSLMVAVPGHDEAKLRRAYEFLEDYRSHCTDKPRIKRRPWGPSVYTLLEFDIKSHWTQRLDNVTRQLEAASTELEREHIPACIVLSQDGKHEIVAKNALWVESPEWS